MKTIAIIGASADRSKFGNKAVRAFLQQGYTVYPVNPKETHIEGLPAFQSIAEVPVRPNLISVYLPPPVLLKVLPAIAAKAVMNSGSIPARSPTKSSPPRKNSGSTSFKRAALSASVSRPRKSDRSA
jgi:hypothetical protein